MTRRALILAVVASLLLPTLNGCRRKPNLDAPEIRFGQDTCAECGMIVSDERFAAAIVLLNPHDERVELLFDDIGEMLNFSLPQHSDVRFWVRDMNTKTWLDATTAFFVVNSELHTPMGTGVAALSSRDAADAVAVSQKGKVVGFEQVRANRP